MIIETTSTEHPLTQGMQRMLFIAGGLVFIVGIQLFILTTATDRFFAWTIKPPLTAAFLGAAYWSSCVLECMAAREQAWSRARIAVPSVLLFTILTLVATLIHIDKFHLDLNTFPFYTVFLTWVWIAVYAIVPVAMSVLLLRQLKQTANGSSDTSPQKPLPSWMRALLVVQGAVMLLPGVVLFFAPNLIVDLWPWQISALTGRTIGAWLLGLGLAAVHMAWENSLTRIYPALLSMVVFVVLQFIALARFPGDIAWDQPQTWFYLFFLMSLLLVGVVGIVQVRQVKTVPASGQESAHPASR